MSTHSTVGPQPGTTGEGTLSHAPNFAHRMHCALGRELTWCWDDAPREAAQGGCPREVAGLSDYHRGLHGPGLWLGWVLPVTP